MNLDINKLFREYSGQCDWLGLRRVQKKSQWRSMLDLRPDKNSTEVERGLMMEVVLDGQLSYAATSDLSPAGLARCFEQAKIQAKQLKGLGLKTFNPKTRGHQSGEFSSEKQTPLSQYEVSDLIQLQKESSQVLADVPNCLSSWVHFWMIETQMDYINSNGAELSQSWERLSQTLGLTAQKGDVIQTRSDGGLFAHSYQMGAEGIKKEQSLERAERLGSEVNELLDAPECPSANCDLLVMPNQMMLQIHESIGHPLELDRILGDERNYAGSSFVKPKDFGQLQYGSELMNVTFDPHAPGEFASYGFDDSGLLAEKKYLIEKGLLKTGLGSGESQERMERPGVSNARATSWNRAPIDRMANINLEPGQSELQEMISSIEYGILVDTNRSWSIDDYRNKFQFGCEYGKLIENGEIKHVVKNPNYRGITVPFWNSLKMLGDRSTFQTFGTPFCGKGEPNQIIDVGHASPCALFQNIDVFGGAS